MFLWIEFTDDDDNDEDDGQKHEHNRKPTDYEIQRDMQNSQSSHMRKAGYSEPEIQGICGNRYTRSLNAPSYNSRELPMQSREF
jgi:hypothetical protein